MHLRSKSPSLLLALAALVLGAVTAFAQATPDAPDITLTDVGHGKLHLTVTAGPSGTPDGFEVCYMTAAQFATLGGVWPAVGWAPGEGWVDYTGVGTLNTWGSGTVDFKLGSGQSLDIEIGDAGDESGVSGTTVGELVDATEYVVCAFALPAAGGVRSVISSTRHCNTSPQGEHCTYTQGYWKNHSSSWPVSGFTLGGVNYSAAQLLSILNKSVGGNGLISLAHQLIAAKLNAAVGASSPSSASTIAAADAAIGSLVVPPVGAGALSPSSTSALTQSLDDFNNGHADSSHCGSTPAHSSTWGGLKSAYR